MDDAVEFGFNCLVKLQSFSAVWFGLVERTTNAHRPPHFDVVCEEDVFLSSGHPRRFRLVFDLVHAEALQHFLVEFGRDAEIQSFWVEQYRSSYLRLTYRTSVDPLGREILTSGNDYESRLSRP